VIYWGPCAAVTILAASVHGSLSIPAVDLYLPTMIEADQLCELRAGSATLSG